MIVAPSVLSADKSRFRDEVIKVKEAGAEFIHLDVMDGRFVMNVTSLIDYLPSIADVDIFKDTHIMVEDIRGYAALYAPHSSLITFHLEASDDVKGDIEYIRGLGCKVGISIKPATPVESLEPYLGDVDLILVMSVEPGKGGQAYLEEATGKIAYLKKKKDERGYNWLIEVDGGINGTTARRAAEAGAEVLVAGSYLYGHEDYRERIEALRRL